PHAMRSTTWERAGREGSARAERAANRIGALGPLGSSPQPLASGDVEVGAVGDEAGAAGEAAAGGVVPGSAEQGHAPGAAYGEGPAVEGARGAAASPAFGDGLDAGLGGLGRG